MIRATSILFFLVLALSQPAHAEVPLKSKAQLQNEATYIVVGKVETIYSVTSKSDDWVDTKSVAEIAIQKVEKGDRIQTGDLVYGRFWNRRWVGEGDPDPFSTGHIGPKKDGLVRAYLVRKNGAYDVILPNGFERVEQQAEQERLAADPEQEAANDLAKVQGKWVRTIRTDSGTYKVIKEHKGNKTTVAWLDSEGNVLAAKKSEFRLEQTDKVRVFTFFNNVVTAGPQKGQTDEGPTSYIYRVTGDTFVEVNGLLIDDEIEPVAFTWKRMNE